MGVEEAFSGLKWDIVEQLAKRPRSPTELADILGTSVANIIYQLKLLTAYGIVSVKREKNSKPGKPRQIFDLAGDQALLIFCSREGVGKRSFKPNVFEKALLNMVLLPEDVRLVVGQILFGREDVVDNAETLALVNSGKDSYDFFVITENLNYFREKIANINLSVNGKKVKVVFWSHNFKETLDGLKKGEHYFQKHFANARIIFDKNNSINLIKKEAGFHNAR